jgi:hypothetical protein
MWWRRAVREERREEKFEHKVLRRLDEIERLLKTPTLTAFQVGDSVMIGNITAGQTGQFAVAVNFPAGVVPPVGYVPVITPSSPDPLITFAPATVDLTNGAVPLAQQFVAAIGGADVNPNGQVGFSALGTDGVTVLTSNVVNFAITSGVIPPTEPTLVASQVG